MNVREFGGHSRRCRYASVRGARARAWLQLALVC